MPTTISRETIDQAYRELSALTGASESLIREAALESAGIDPYSGIGFTSQGEEERAIAFLAATFGQGSADMPGTGPGEVELSDHLDGAEIWASQEVARLAEVAPARQTINRQGQLRVEMMIDPVKAGRALSPRAPARRVLPDPELSAAGEAEVDRLLALAQGQRRPVRPDNSATGGRRAAEEVELSAPDVDGYLRLAADMGMGRDAVEVGDGMEAAPQRPAPLEVSVSDDSDTSTQAEIDRLVDQARGLFGTSPAPLMNTTGNASYAPGPESEWGQFRKGPWHSEYGGAA